MTKSAQKIENALDGVQKLGLMLKVLFTVLIALTALLAFYIIYLVGCAMAHGFVFQNGCMVFDAGERSVNPFFAAVWLLFLFTIEAMVRGIAVDMSRRVSPFTVRHARMLQIVGLAFVVNFILGIIWPNADVQLSMGTSVISIVPNSMTMAFGEDALQIDFGSILGALIAFSMSLVWRYGALLQTQTDDLV